MDKNNKWLIVILFIGVFGILNTEMGIIGILPSIAEHYGVSVSRAGLLVSLFALAVSISGPTLPLLFSGINRKKVMLLVLGVFLLGNVVSVVASNFTIALFARVLPAFLHPVYISIALTTAASSVSKEDAPKAISKVIMGVSAGMVLGVPVAAFIANTGSLEAAMLFFTLVNAIAFIITLLWVPSMPVKERLTYGVQLSVLRKSITWLSIAAVIFINAAVYAVYSYLSEYLETITQLSGETISLLLLLFGVASIVGNLAAGRLLANHAVRTVVIYPFALAAIYILLFIMGEFTAPIVIIVLVWGILFAVGNNISQYWMMSAASEAPEFANGLFLAFGNLGITIGTTVGGLLLAGMGTPYVVIGGLLFLVLSLIFILARNYLYAPKHKVEVDRQ